MERFYLEEPTIERKQDAIEYVLEHKKYASPINGSASLTKYIDQYENWLIRLENKKNNITEEGLVPARTYFLIRENDNKIIGMISIRLTLNDKLKRHGGHIGYGIRPTERGKGYNKINLYLGLQKCQEFGLDKVILDANIDNIASWKTMEALNGKRIKTYLEENDNLTFVRYEIDVLEALEKTQENYQEKVIKENKR